jgi:methylmalonyl-CoA mutase, C-terminal domain
MGTVDRMRMRVIRLMGEQGVTPKRIVRVVVAKVGLDGHDRGVKIVARALRDAGMEVIYTGLHRRPEEVVAIAIVEDVDVIGVSILSGAHMTIFPRLIAIMKERGVWDEIALVGGGVIPDEDVSQLLAMGVGAIIGQDATPAEVVAAVRQQARPRV